MLRVPKDLFFKTIGTMDVVVSCTREETFWKTRQGRIIGKVDQGYIPPVPAREPNYYLTTDLPM